MKPQEYEHRVAVTIESIAAALAGAQLLVSYLTEQLGPQWRDQKPKTVQARKEFQRARTWLKAIDRQD